MKSTEAPLRVLVIDDSAANRKAISRILEQTSDLEVIDRAEDGEEGLKKALALKPDVITLDLEMPRLDGFAFLRLLMNSAPTPVVVLSSYGHPSDVFKALQLGAFDFVAKPGSKGEGGSVDAVRTELVQKIRSARSARRTAPPPRVTPPAVIAQAARAPAQAPALLVIGASTGGPPAVQKILESISHLPVAVLIAQHMPARFTDAFADRLNQVVSMRVTEARSGMRPEPGHAYIAPGGQHLELVQSQGTLSLVVSASSAHDKYAPSVDLLFTSVAKLGLRDTQALVLTGMGSDGAAGVKALAAAGIQVWAESEETAVVFGMPQAAILTGKVSHVMALGDLGPSLARALRKGPASG